MFLCADESCLVSQGKNVKEIKKKLNGDLTNTCEWLVDNKLSIHFRKDTTKFTLFTSTRKIKKETSRTKIYTSNNIQMPHM